MEDKYYSRVIKMMVFILDFYLISLAFTITKKLGVEDGIPDSQETSFFLIFSLIWVISGFLTEIYRINKLTSFRNIVWNLAGSLLVHFCLLMLLLFTTNLFQLEGMFLPVLYAFTFSLLVASRVAY
jgi:hypothetical protein